MCRNEMRIRTMALREIDDSPTLADAREKRQFDAVQFA